MLPTGDVSEVGVEVGICESSGSVLACTVNSLSSNELRVFVWSCWDDGGWGGGLGGGGRVVAEGPGWEGGLGAEGREVVEGMGARRTVGWERRLSGGVRDVGRGWGIEGWGEWERDVAIGQGDDGWGGWSAEREVVEGGFGAVIAEGKWCADEKRVV